LLEDPARLKAAIRAVRARRSLIDFVLLTYPGYQAGWFHREVCKKLDAFFEAVRRRESPRLMIFAPPRSGKSELFSRRGPAYALGRDPDLNIIATSYSADLASRMNRDVQRIIDDERYREIFPGVGLSGATARGSRRTPDEGTYIRNSDLFEVVGHRGVYRAAGIGGGIVGMGADILIIDDPIKEPEQAYSETYREKLWEWYTMAAYTRLMPGGGILLGHTRWHAEDLAGRLLAAQDEGGDRWDVVLYPAVADADEPHRKAGEALHPERWPIEKLDAIRAVIGPTAWSASYQQRPTPPGGGMFRREYFPVQEAALAGRMARVRYWDLASSVSSTADFTVGLRMSRTPDGIFFVEDMIRGRWTPFERDKVILQTAQLDGREVQIRIEQEPGSSGVSQIASMVRMLAGYDIHPDRVTGDKVTRAAPFAAQCEARNVRLVNGPWVRDFLDEVMAFPFGKHDDVVDGASGAFNTLALAPLPIVLRPAANPLAGYRG
jgi:predicted phage terminase large subunit-like protein